MYDKDFYTENKSYVFAFIVVAVLCVCGIWLCHDLFRNEPIYHGTDESMGKLEERISSIEQRVDTIQGRLAETQKAVSGINAGIKHSTELAGEITSGLGTAATRLDSAIQRSGRIQNIINEIERANK